MKPAKPYSFIIITAMTDPSTMEVNQNDDSEARLSQHNDVSSRCPDVERYDDSEHDLKNFGLSDYERQRLERIKRNQDRLVSLGLYKEQKIITPKTRKRLHIDTPRRELPSRSGRANFTETSSRKEKKEKEMEKNPDACSTCQSEKGDLMSCECCRKLYHSRCHPPVSSDEGFRCFECKGAGRKRRVACGQCSACNAEDCQTCVVCVNKTSDITKKHKCIFRRCKSWGKGVLGKGDTCGNEENDEKRSDKHESYCDICKKGSYLISCVRCTRVFHSNCHKPKIYSLPEVDWHCMHCQRMKKKRSLTKPKYTDSLIAIMNEKEITVTVRWPKLKCIVCEEDEVTSSSLNLSWTTCRICHSCWHLKCLSPPLQHRPNSWRCCSCRDKMISYRNARKETSAKPKYKSHQSLFEGAHDDDCFICNNGGDLICCDFCCKVFHMQCHVPPLDRIPKGVWKCCECAASQYKRMFRCGECIACNRDDCGKCTNCLDKPKFGGLGRYKQVCETKRCRFKRLAPPASTPKKSYSEKEREPRFAMNTECNTGDLKRKLDGDAYLPMSKRNLPRKNTEDVTYDEDSDPTDRKLEQPPQCRQDNPKSSLHHGKVQSHVIERGYAVKSCDSLALANPSLMADPVGSKIRKIIQTALKRQKKLHVQEHTCKYLRIFITNEERANLTIRLGGLLILAKAMYHYPGETSLQVEANATLMRLVAMKPSCGQEIIISSCVALAVNSMQSHKSCLKIQQTGCALFRALSYDFGVHEMIKCVNGLEAVVDCLIENSKQIDRLLDGLCFLQNLLCNPRISGEVSKFVVSRGLIPVIVDGMAAFEYVDGQYLRSASAVIANLALHENARMVIGDYEKSIPTFISILNGETDVISKKSFIDIIKLVSDSEIKFSLQCAHNQVVKIIMSLISRHYDDVLLVKSALDTITRDEQSSTLFDVGDCRTLLSEMHRHSAIYFVQLCGCRILRKLSTPDMQTEDTKAAVESILAALNRFRFDESIQFDGRHALVNLWIQYPLISQLLHFGETISILKHDYKVIRDEIDVHSEATEMEKIVTEYEHKIEDNNISTMSDDDVCTKIKAIIKKALKHPTDHKIQDKAIENIRKYAKDAESAEKVIRLGGLDMIETAMENHPDKVVVQGEANATLADLIWKHPSCSEAVAKTGCLSLMANAMRNHWNHTKLQQMGCSVFRALSYEDKNQCFINRVDGLAIVIESVKRNPKKHDIVKEACLSMPNCPQESIASIISNGVVPIIVDCMFTSMDADFIENACGFIKNLAIDDVARAAIGKYELSIQTIISVLESKSNDPASKDALDALVMLMDNDDNRSQLAHHDGVQAVISCVKHHLGNTALVTSALQLLLVFTKGNSSIVHAETIFEFLMTEMMNPCHSTTHVLACHIFGNLSIQEHEKAKLAFEFVLASMKNNKNDGSVQSAGLKALMNISVTNPSIAAAVRTEENLSILRKSEFQVH